MLLLKLTRPAHVMVGVHQRDERTLGAPSEYAHVGFAVLKDGKYVTGCSPAADRQQFSPDIKELNEWPAGEYTVCAYCLQHSLRKPKSNYFTDSWPSSYDPVAFRTTTDEIFSRFNVSGSGSLSVGEGGEAAALLASVRSYEDRRHHATDGACARRDGLSSSDLGNWLQAHPTYTEILKRVRIRAHVKRLDLRRGAGPRRVGPRGRRGLTQTNRIHTIHRKGRRGAAHPRNGHDGPLRRPRGLRRAAAVGRVGAREERRLAKDEGDGGRGQVAQLPVPYRGPRRVGVPKSGRGAGAPPVLPGGAGRVGFCARGRCSGALCIAHAPRRVGFRDAYLREFPAFVDAPERNPMRGLRKALRGLSRVSFAVRGSGFPATQLAACKTLASKHLRNLTILRGKSALASSACGPSIDDARELMVAQNLLSDASIGWAKSCLSVLARSAPPLYLPLARHRRPRSERVAAAMVSRPAVPSRDIALSTIDVSAERHVMGSQKLVGDTRTSRSSKIQKVLAKAYETFDDQVTSSSKERSTSRPSEKRDDFLDVGFLLTDYAPTPTASRSRSAST